MKLENLFIMLLALFFIGCFSNKNKVDIEIPKEKVNIQDPFYDEIEKYTDYKIKEFENEVYKNNFYTIKFFPSNTDDLGKDTIYSKNFYTYLFENIHHDMINDFIEKLTKKYQNNNIFNKYLIAKSYDELINVYNKKYFINILYNQKLFTTILETNKYYMIEFDTKQKKVHFYYPVVENKKLQDYCNKNAFNLLCYNTAIKEGHKNILFLKYNLGKLLVYKPNFYDEKSIGSYVNVIIDFNDNIKIWIPTL